MIQDFFFSFLFFLIHPSIHGWMDPWIHGWMDTYIYINCKADPVVFMYRIASAILFFLLLQVGIKNMCPPLPAEVSFSGSCL